MPGPRRRRRTRRPPTWSPGWPRVGRSRRPARRRWTGCWERTPTTPGCGRGGPDAVSRLKPLSEKSPQRKLQAAAALALARVLAEKIDGLAEKPAEADK